MVQSLLSFAQSHFRRIEPRVQTPEIESQRSTKPPGSGTPGPLAIEEPYDRAAQQLEITWRHSGWARDRKATFDSLYRTYQPFSRYEAFRYCGAHAWVDRSVDDPTKYRVRSDRCHDRFCLPCGQERSRVIAHNVRERLDAKRARFVTLTIRASTEALTDLLNLLYSSFAKLRRTCLWSQTQTGGVAFLEVKWCKGTNRWHPHLHILTEGRYIAKQALSNAWRKATNGSFIVDVKKITSADRAVGYVVKYASKPHDHSMLHDPDRLDEAVIALKGRRLCLTFGTWRGVKLTDVPETGTWTPIASLSRLIVQARAGEPAAKEILNHLPSTSLPNECRAPPDAIAENTEDGLTP